MKEENSERRKPASDIAFTPAVKTIQQRLGSRDGYARMERGRGWKQRIDDGLAGFIAERDSFYLGTATADGQPYIQHRGGRPGFLKAIGPRTLAFAEFGGNRQYISMGNLSENDRAFIFLMDYAQRRRVKIWGRARFVEDDSELLRSLIDDDYPAVPERALVFQVEAWDVNCPQHITPRFTQAEVERTTAGLAQENRTLRARVSELESLIAREQESR